MKLAPHLHRLGNDLVAKHPGNKVGWVTAMDVTDLDGDGIQEIIARTEPTRRMMASSRSRSPPSDAVPVATTSTSPVPRTATAPGIVPASM